MSSREIFCAVNFVDHHKYVSNKRTYYGIRNMSDTACSNMAKQGMDVKVLQYLMGHAHSDVTMGVYNHIASKQDIKEEVERYARVAGN